MQSSATNVRFMREARCMAWNVCFDTRTHLWQVDGTARVEKAGKLAFLF